MDGWSRPNHMPSHLDALQTTTSVNFRRVPGNLHSVAERASSCVVFPVDFRCFGRPTWMQKSTFGPYLCDVIFECVFISIPHRFVEAPNLKNELSFRREHDFCKIDVFQKRPKNVRFGLHFRRLNPRKIDLKSHPQICCSSTSIFMRFFVMLAPF